MTFDLTNLAAPFSPAAIHWRAQSVSKDGNKAMALAYIDARDVMARLDEVCGPANWQDSYAETPKGRLICTLSIRIDGEWISKSDGAGDTDVEGEKGAISDALKRAAVKWGVGRYLYDMPTPWVECESYDSNGRKRWSKWTAAGLRELARIAGNNIATLPPQPISDAQWAEITSLIDTSGADAKAFCEHFGIAATKDLPAGRFEEARTMLHRKLKQKATA